MQNPIQVDRSDTPHDPVSNVLMKRSEMLGASSTRVDRPATIFQASRIGRVDQAPGHGLIIGWSLMREGKRCGNHTENRFKGGGLLLERPPPAVELRESRRAILTRGSISR
jgi:hypothetical protein